MREIPNISLEPIVQEILFSRVVEEEEVNEVVYPGDENHDHKGAESRLTNVLRAINDEEA